MPDVVKFRFEAGRCDNAGVAYLGRPHDARAASLPAGRPTGRTPRPSAGRPCRTGSRCRSGPPRTGRRGRWSGRRRSAPPRGRRRRASMPRSPGDGVADDHGTHGGPP
jgi:hypothetical protein